MANTHIGMEVFILKQCMDNKSNITVRSAVPEDAAALLKIYAPYVKERLLRLSMMYPMFRNSGKECAIP